jgi:hypothetical protein
MTDLRNLHEILRATESDAGCGASAEVADAYVKLKLAGEDPAHVYLARSSTSRAAAVVGAITTGCVRRHTGSLMSGPSGSSWKHSVGCRSWWSGV